MDRQEALYPDTHMSTRNSGELYNYAVTSGDTGRRSHHAIVERSAIGNDKFRVLVEHGLARPMARPNDFICDNMVAVESVYGMRAGMEFRRLLFDYGKSQNVTMICVLKLSQWKIMNSEVPDMCDHHLEYLLDIWQGWYFRKGFTYRWIADDFVDQIAMTLRWVEYFISVLKSGEYHALEDEIPADFEP